MIVIDASAMVEALVGADASAELFGELTDDLHAPHLLDVEVMSALRGLALGGRLDAGEAEHAWRDFSDFNIARHAFDVVADRVWSLQSQFTTYDASYLALAEALDADVVTCDAKLDTHGTDATVRVFPRSR